MAEALSLLSSLAPHLIWGVVVLLLARTGARTYLERVAAKRAPETKLDSKLSELEQKVVQLDVRTRPTPKLR